MSLAVELSTPNMNPFKYPTPKVENDHCDNGASSSASNEASSMNVPQTTLTPTPLQLQTQMYIMNDRLRQAQQQGIMSYVYQQQPQNVAHEQRMPQLAPPLVASLSMTDAVSSEFPQASTENDAPVTDTKNKGKGKGKGKMSPSIVTCARCRSLHQRCTGWAKGVSCTRCIKAGCECKEATIKKRGPRKGWIKELKAKAALLDQQQLENAQAVASTITPIHSNATTPTASSVKKEQNETQRQSKKKTKKAPSSTVLLMTPNPPPPASMSKKDHKVLNNPNVSNFLNSITLNDSVIAAITAASNETVTMATPSLPTPPSPAPSNSSYDSILSEMIESGDIPYQAPLGNDLSRSQSIDDIVELYVPVGEVAPSTSTESIASLML